MSPGRTPKPKSYATLATVILVLSILPSLAAVAPVVAQHQALCTAPVDGVCFEVVLSSAAGVNAGSPVTFGLSGCSVTPSSLPGDGRAHWVNASSDCDLTISAPAATSSEQVVFSNLAGSLVITTCTSDPCSVVRASFYDDVLVTYSYSVTSGTPTAPTLRYSDEGTIYSVAAPESPSTVQYWTDVGTAATFTNPIPGSPGSRWYTAEARDVITRSTTTVEPEYYYQTLQTFSASPYVTPQTIPPATLSTWSPPAKIEVSGSAGGVVAPLCSIYARARTSVDSCTAYIDSGKEPVFAQTSVEGPYRWYLGGNTSSTGYYYLQYLVQVVVSPWYAGTISPGPTFVTPGNEVTFNETPCTIGSLYCTFDSWRVGGTTSTGTSVTVTPSGPTTVFAQYSVSRDASCPSNGCTFVQLNWVFLNRQGGASICVPGVLYRHPHFYYWGNCPRVKGQGWPYPVTLFPPTCSLGLVCMQITGGAPGDRGTLFYGNLTTYSSDHGVEALDGALQYFDVAYVGFYRSNPATTMVQVCIGENGVGSGSQIEYWNGATWVSVATTYEAPAVCGTIALSHLKGTNIAVTPGVQTTTTETTTAAQTIATTTTATTTFYVATSTTTTKTGTLYVQSSTQKTLQTTVTGTTSTTATTSTTVTANVISTTTQLLSSVSTVVSTTPIFTTSVITSVSTAVSTAISTVTSTQGAAITQIASGYNPWLLGGLVVSLLLLLALLALLMRNRKRDEEEV